MNGNLISLCLMVGIVACGIERADAQVVRKAGQLIMNKAFREAGEEAIETAGKKVLREAGEAALQRSARTAAQPLVGSGIRKAATTIGNKAALEAGEHAAAAASRLTARNARRLAMLEKELIASGKGPEVMSVLAKHGKADQLVDFLWRNKGTLATGTLLAAVVTNPDGVLGATGDMGSKLIEASGKQIAQPLIKETAKPIFYIVVLGMLIASGALTVFGGVALFLRFGRKWMTPAWSWFERPTAENLPTEANRAGSEQS